MDAAVADDAALGICPMQGLQLLEPAQEAPRDCKRKKSEAAEGDAQPCLLVKKLVLEHLRKQAPSLRCGGDFFEALNAAVKELLDMSVSRATANGRLTVRKCDL